MPDEICSLLLRRLGVGVLCFRLAAILLPSSTSFPNAGTVTVDNVATGRAHGLIRCDNATPWTSDLAAAIAARADAISCKSQADKFYVQAESLLVTWFRKWPLAVLAPNSVSALMSKLTCRGKSLFECRHLGLPMCRHR